MSGIIIDTTRLVGRLLRGRLPTGIDRVAQAYLSHFGSRARAALTVRSRAFALPEAASRRLFDALQSPEPKPPVLRALLNGALHTPLRYDMAGHWFLNTGHTGLHRPGYEAMLAALRVRPLYVIHDLIPLTHPQFCRESEARLHARRMILALRTGAALVCNSRATWEGLGAFAAQQDLPMPPASVALLGTDSMGADAIVAARAQRPLARPYFLMVGTIEPRKNHLLMLQVWQRLVREQGEAAPMLVLIGQQGWECEHVVRLLERATELREHVLQLRRCTDLALRRWLAHAQALLFPSFAEGFGLPVLEALELGVPVIAADLPVYREFAGALPEYLDPLDAAGWQAAIAAYADSSDRRRQRRVEALTGFTGPSWTEHFARVDDLMQRIDYRSGISSSPRPRAQAASQPC